MPLALTRRLGPAIARCELTHFERRAIDVGRAIVQHEGYERALAGLGCRVLTLPEEPDLPDAVFVEDAAVVFPELAVITRPGAPSRRGETASVARALAEHRPLAAIEEPATLDGGDVLRIGRRLMVGLSSRTNEEGIRQLRNLLAGHGYTVRTVRVRGCLHLKSAATEVAPGVVLLNPAFVDPAAFPATGRIEVDPSEPLAANALAVGGGVIHPSAFPRTAARLHREGIRVVPVDISEIAKAEGAVTCCSLILDG